MIYEKIKKLCEENGISIRQIEMQAGLKNGAISKWKKSMPQVDNLKAVADILQKPIDYFLSESNDAGK